MKKWTKLGRLGLAAALVVGMTACAGATTPEGEGDELLSIRIAPTSPSALAMAPAWVALALGFYEEEGLDVEIIGNVPGGSVEDALTNGDLQIGGSAYSNLWPRADELAEADVQIKAFLPDGAFAWRLMVLANSEAQQPSDLRGTLIGITEAGGDETTTDVLMALDGVAPDEFETVVTGGRAAGGVALDRGQVQAFQGSYIDEWAISSEFDIRVLETGLEDELFMGGWAARTDWLEANPDVPVQFGRAWAKGAIWAFENPEAAIDLIAQVNPESVTDKASALEILKLVNAHNRPLYDIQYKLASGDVETVLAICKELGLVVDELEIDDVYTTEYLERIWDFDVEAVIAEARAG